MSTNPAFENDEKEGTKKSPDLFVIPLSSEKSEDNEQYNPFEHRTVKHPTTNAETLLHLLKGSLGTGILAMPKAFYHAGWVLGIVGTLVIGLLCLYCIHLLIDAEHELCRRKKKPSMTYPETAQEALKIGPEFLQKFADWMPGIINTFLLIYQLGACCVYVVFIGENVQTVMNQYVGYYDVSIYMLVFLIPLILINWIRNLKYLAPFSTLANIVTAVSFGIIFYFIFNEGLTLEKREPVGEIGGIPLFFGTVLFALEAIGVIMPLENEMKTPHAFAKPCGVLNIGFGVIVFLYITMGILGYLAFGDTVKDSITLNLEKENVLAQVVQITLALAIYVTHALQCYVAVDITWNMYLMQKFEKNDKKLIWEYVVRTALVLVTFILAVSVPRLGLFISLFGAFCLSALGLAIPALINLSTYWTTREGIKFKFMLVKNSLLIVFSLLGLVAGTYVSISEIVKSFTENEITEP